MSMQLTDQNRSEVREIARETMKEYSLNAKEDSKKLTETIEKMFESFGATIKAELQSIRIHFQDKIDYMILERQSEVSNLKNEHKICQLNHSSEMKKFGSEMVSKKALYIVAGGVYCSIVAPVMVALVLFWLKIK